MAGGSKRAVYFAIVGNSLVTVAKLVGFGLTGSGAMLSEGIHSAADVANQSLLALGLRRGELPPDEEHPDGYGREAFVWSIISAVGIFFLGCGVTLMHGISSLTSDHGHKTESLGLAIGILLFALVIEGIALWVAVAGLRAEAKSRQLSFWEHVRTTSDPFGVAVLLEDSAAVFGVLIALAAVVLTKVTGHAYWDAIGSIAIGVLLGMVALFLIAKNRSLLIGEKIHVQRHAELVGMLENDPAVDEVVTDRAVVTGAQTFRFSAELEFSGTYMANRFLEGRSVTEIREGITSDEALVAFLEEFGEALMDQVGDEVDRIESKIRENFPAAQRVELEPD